MAYPTTAALVAASTQPDLLALSAPQQDSLRAAAITGVESYTGQSFTEFDGVVELESQGGADLYLPRRLRVLRSITPFNGTPLELEPLYIPEDGTRILFRRNAVGVGYYEQALMEVSGHDYYTHFPTQTVVIDGEWGWAAPPDAVTLALRYDMEEQAAADANALSGTTLAFRKLGLSQIAQGGLRADLSAVPTLSPRVQALLEPHIWLGRGGKLV